MATTRFSRELSVPGGAEQVWNTITDVPRVVSWVSVCEDVQEHEPLARYTATLADRLGMFSLRADLDITVLGHETAKWIKAHGAGTDRQIGSRVTVDVDVELRADGDRTVVTVAGGYEVTGRAATMGSATIRRKADKVLDEFFGSLERALS